MDKESQAPPSSRRLFWLVILLAAIPLLGWWTYGLFDLDEGFYGAVVVEMNRRHEWIVPYYNASPWWEKPILLYWLAKPAVAIFGTDWGGRLPSIVASLAGSAFTFWWAKRRLCLAAAQISVLALATSLLWVGLSRMMMTDMLLTVAFNAACLLFYESLVGDRRWRVVAAGLIGVGVLAKGPVALLLFVPIALWTWWREKELRPAYRGAWLATAAVFLLVVASWYLTAYLRAGNDFVQGFLVEQNLNRFAGGDQAHTVRGFAGLVFYIPILLLGMAPWSLWIFKAWPRKGDDSLTRYLAVCAAVPFLFFTVSGAKLVHYILPCFIPIALLVADRLSFRWSKDGEQLDRKPLAFLAAGCLATCVLANLGFGWWYQASGQAEVHGLARKIPDGALVAAYQMPRRQQSLGTGKPKLQETSLPSLLFYLDRPILEAERPEQLARAGMPLYVLTRHGRLLSKDFELLRKAGLRYTRLSLRTSPNYELYRLDDKDRVSSPSANTPRSIGP